LLHKTWIPSGHRLTTSLTASRTEAKDWRSQATLWIEALGKVFFRVWKDFVALSELRFRRRSFAPKPARVDAATNPVPEVVPVITTVLPSIEGKLCLNSGKCIDSIFFLVYDIFFNHPLFLTDTLLLISRYFK
jgi:hypothetical protein